MAREFSSVKNCKFSDKIRYSYYDNEFFIGLTDCFYWRTL